MTKINHVALQFKTKKEADIFFEKILDIPKVKEFDLSKNLSEEIFNVSKEVSVCVYDNQKTRFEVFISGEKQDFSFNHICIEIKNREKFIEKCKKYDLEVNLVKKGEKTLLFIKDFNKNIYEVKS